MKLRYSLILALTTSIAIGATGFWLYQTREEEREAIQKVQEEELIQQLKVAEGLLHRSHPVRALEVLQNTQKEALSFPVLADIWAELALETARALGDDRILNALYTYRPDLFREEEDLVLRLAANFLLQNNIEQYTVLRDSWKSKSHHPHQWFLLEADALALQGEAEKSLDLLLSKTLYGDEEIKRLLRLAVLNEMEHPKIAWDYLSRALKLDPSAAELHYYRAQLLNSTPHKDLAALEYAQATQVMPNESLYREELVRFYLDQRNYPKAYALLQTSLQPPSSDRLWLDAIFMSRVYRPFNFEFSQSNIPIGELTPLVRYLLSLPAHQLWNSRLLSVQPNVQDQSQRQPETLWIEIVSDLKEGDDVRAFELLQSHPEIATLQPALYNALQIAIAHKFAHLNLKPTSVQLSQTNQETLHPLFKQLQEPTFSTELQQLLSSKEGYTPLFLAAGWYEAALSLHQMQKFPAHFPRWVAYGLTQALALNRSPEHALLFARGQVQSPQLELLIGELSLKTGKFEEAIVALTPLAASSSQVGVQAVSLLTNLFVEQENYELAFQMASANKAYASSLKGQEQLARLALQLGNLDEADSIYTKIMDKSSEAKSFIASKAYLAQDYPKALQLTQELLKQYPHRKDLQEQLAMIVQKSKQEHAPLNTQEEEANELDEGRESSSIPKKEPSEATKHAAL